MEVILLERIGRLGQMGDVVRVKDGYARNFLLPKGKALRATSDNKTRFKSMRADLETKNKPQRVRPERSPASSKARCWSRYVKPPKPGNCSARCRRVTSPT